MSTVRPTAMEIATTGEHFYNERMKALVEPTNVGRYIAIDTVSGQYEIGDDHMETVDALYAACPNAIPYTKRIGYSSAVVIGGRLKRDAA